MSFVALQFEDNQILVGAARSAATRLQISHLFAIDLSGDDSSSTTLLKAKLGQHGLSKCDAIIVINRADAEMRELIVPPAPDNEIPEMVRFIARNEFASLNENWSLDYLPISGDSTQARTVLAAGASPELLGQIKKISTGAGLKVKHIVLRPFAALDLIRARLTGNECRLIVDPNGHQTDMTLVDGAALLATRTVRIPETYDANQRSDSMLSEVRRTLASSRKLLGDRQITEVVMFGNADEYKILEGNLRNKLDLGIEFIQPLSAAPLASGCEQPEHPEQFAAILGSLVQHHSKQPHSIDFVNPRRPIVAKSDFSKWYLYGGLALAASLMVVVAGWWVLSSQSKINADYASRLAKLKKLNQGNETTPSVDSILREIVEIDEWKLRDVNWLRELSEYSGHSLSPDDSIVDSLDAVAPLRAEADPRMTVNMRITEVPKESELIDELGTRPYMVQTKRGVVDQGDKNYPLSSTLNITLDLDESELIKEYDERANQFLQGPPAKTVDGSVSPDESDDPVSPSKAEKS